MESLHRLRGLFQKPADDTRVRLDEVMRLRGIAQSLPLDQAEALDAAAATQRCMQCPRKRLCDEALAGGRNDALRLFCPNAHYVEYLRSRSLKFA